MAGSTWTAPASGTITHLTVLYGTGANYTGNFRLAIYAASSPTSWGVKLAETASQSGINTSQSKKIALTTPLDVVAGQLYALCVQTDNNFGVRADTAYTCYYFTDSYADGAAANAGSLGSFTGAPVILATGTPITPAFSASPTITTDTGFFAEGDTATVSYTHNSPSTSIQWTRDGVAISGATSASYTYVSGDVGHVVACTVTAINGSLSASASASGTTIGTPSYTTHTRVPAGDMDSGSDSRLTAGDMQSGSDLRISTERTA
ncbi:hypothetical protein MRBLMA1_001250 [Sphingobium sp. LMA1-1-1.1]|uniref:hypothetical protein n=1 Tax=Sphingobium sp. LMA1-1-1.1 TaxID=3135238 RepID=UPI00341BFFD1